ncbi:MAG: neutral/alkaline non-lysosomal ceramidase N-terminal domain-containing protein [Fuerstiella sp.]|nr:neutral/alkaline non-lysosomal ceramidase N-terminal domain-containing protein [Fuerstiella sp.]
MHCFYRGFVIFVAVFAVPVIAYAAEPLTIQQPQPHQVIQRKGIASGFGYANVRVRGVLPPESNTAEWEYRVVPTNGGTSVGPKTESGQWNGLKITVDDDRFVANVRIGAGGWYRLDVRYRREGSVIAVGTVEPFGVGEVFLVAGQSYATNCNDEQFNVTDPHNRVAALDSTKGTWRVATDPQPVMDSSDGGSIWPPLGDALANDLGVPIGFANVAVKATSSMQWRPQGKLHPPLVRTGQTLGNFRAVLWQQGESDVIAKTSTANYVANLTVIRDAAAKQWTCDPPWLLAKSTLHPTVYNDPTGETRIRTAIEELVRRPGFRAGPDTDSLKGSYRGDANSRRHFSAAGQRAAANLWRTAIYQMVLPQVPASKPFHVGLAEADITPPRGFPMAGYYHERLAQGTNDPLQAKAIVFRDGDESAALVVCDLIGISTDLSRKVRQRVSEQTDIPRTNIVIAATHSHTAPDYMKELWLTLGKRPQNALRRKYINSLIEEIVAVTVDAAASAKPALVESGTAVQQMTVSFNRRFVMRDGSVKTWQNFTNPNVIRAAGPIDPVIGLLAVRSETGDLRGVFSNFALHLDTVGGQKWSADYPFFIDRTLKSSTGPDVISIFGTGCCGDINHSNPRSTQRNTAGTIGTSIGDSIVRRIDRLQPIEQTALVVKSRTVQLPLQNATNEEVADSVRIVAQAGRGEKVDFFEHVTAYKKIILDHFRHAQPFETTSDHITWGLSRSLAGIGPSLPVDVTVMTIGRDVAIVCLPGEVFVELGLAIKQGSPFHTTMIVELSNAVETIYIPNRAAYAGGSYEVTNSAVQPGSGEILVETALTLLREAATAN